MKTKISNKYQRGRHKMIKEEEAEERLGELYEVERYTKVEKEK